MLSLLLRGESGGAITSDEWTSYGPTYLPWPGDSDAEIARKMRDLKRLANDTAFMSGSSARSWVPFDVNDKKDQGVVDLTPQRR